jgi:ABC-type multidrug transport system ATPase subunit
MNAVMTICDYALLLDHGKTVSFGIPRSIVDLYIARLCIQSHSGEKPVNLVETENRWNAHSNISTNEIEFH